jgi:hypothetical protein
LWITTYLNKKKTMLRGDFRLKITKNHPLNKRMKRKKKIERNVVANPTKKILERKFFVDHVNVKNSNFGKFKFLVL